MPTDTIPGGHASAPEWLVEPKWDGVRAIVEIQSGAVRLWSRNDNEITAAYPELTTPPPSLVHHDAVLDGEVVALDDGRPSFGLLQQRMHVRHPAPALVERIPVDIVVFDLLWLDGRRLTSDPLRERRAALADLNVNEPPWATSPLLDLQPGPELLAVCRELGLEGFMLKRAGSAYHPGERSADWVKVKAVRRREFVVGGWLEGKAGRTGALGSLALGVHDPYPLLRFVGMVGSGLSGADIAAFARLADELRSETTPFVGPTPDGVRFLEPVLVAEVSFSEVTAAGTLRHPVLEGFRSDLEAADVGPDEQFPSRKDELDR